MRDPNTVAGIVNLLRQVHGDDIARVMLNNGLSLAALIDAAVRSPMTNRDAVKLISRALDAGDFIITPDFGSLSHVKYFYDRPGSLHVVDMAVVTQDRGTIASTDHPLAIDAQRPFDSPPLLMSAVAAKPTFGLDFTTSPHT